MEASVPNMVISAIVMGTSAGGLKALTAIFEGLPADFSAPIVVVQHRARQDLNLLESLLQAKCRLRVKQADEKELLDAGTIYIAPPDYHLLVERDRTLSLSTDPPVHFSRPSIDVLFESAAAAFGRQLLAVLLTGASQDGARGVATIARHGGVVIAQNPQSAAFPFMPQSAIDTGKVHHVMDLKQIQQFLLRLNQKPPCHAAK